MDSEGDGDYTIFYVTGAIVILLLIFWVMVVIFGNENKGVENSIIQAMKDIDLQIPASASTSIPEIGIEFV